MSDEQFSLCWDNFHKNMSCGMHALLENEDLVDVTIAVEGKYLKAHRMVLSVCSPYFKELFQTSPCKHPIIFMRDVSYIAMNDLLTFMYQGEVQVNQEHLTAFIKTAEALQIKGLTGDGNYDPTEILEEHEEDQIKPVSTSTEERITQRPKKIVSQKRPRLSNSNTECKVPKIEQGSIPQATEIIQFKMEPFETTETGESEHFANVGDNQTETYADDVIDESHLDEATMDDPEDYSMLEGDDEPKPGTSADTGGDSQDHLQVEKVSKTVRKFHKIVHQGFFYNISTTRLSNKRYYRCANKKNTGCLGTAALGKHDPVEKLAILRPHNHPPDRTMEMKYNFEMELAAAVKNSSASIKVVYDTMAQIYPEAAKLVSYDSNLLNRMKRRRASTFYSY